MKKALVLTSLVALMGASIAMAACPAGCGSTGCGAGAAKEVKLCSKCGEVKGLKECCKADLKKCGACGLNKKSPGCKAACATKK